MGARTLGNGQNVSHGLIEMHVPKWRVDSLCIDFDTDSLHSLDLLHLSTQTVEHYGQGISSSV